MKTALGTTKLLPTYPPVPVTFTRGDGMWLFDEDDRRHMEYVHERGSFFDVPAEESHPRAFRCRIGVQPESPGDSASAGLSVVVRTGRHMEGA